MQTTDSQARVMVVQKQLDGGSLVTIAPLEEKHVSRAADLLAIAFSEAINAEVYRRFLRRQIVDYLMGVYKLESCALLVAQLHSHALGNGGAHHALQHRLHCAPARLQG